MKPIDILRMVSPGSSSSGPIAISDRTITKIGNGTAPITVTYTVGSDGYLYNQAGANLGQWLLSGSSSSYQVQATLVSGTTPSGTLNSWLLCSTSRSWSLTVPVGTNDSCVISVSIRDAASPNTVRDTASITLNGFNTG